MFRLANPDAGAPCRSVECTASWEYDGRERLIKEVAGTGTTSEFRLDAAGNVTEEKRNGATYRTASYTGQRLTTSTQAGSSLRYLYDAQGNVDCVVLASWAASTCPAAATGQAVAGELVSDNVYDYRDRLVAVRSYAGGSLGDRSEYRYDPLGRPVKKIASEGSATTTTEMLYLGVADTVVRETETGSQARERSYAFDALGQRATLSESVSGSTARFGYAADPHGSVELLVDRANGVKAAYGYLAYGEANPALTKTASGFEANTNPYRYSGKRWDPAARAYDMGARHYSAAVGRFLQHDAYTDALANLGLSLDPLGGNRYALAAGNPIGYVELDGHVVVAEGGGRYDAGENAFELRRQLHAEGCTKSQAAYDSDWCRHLRGSIVQEAVKAAEAAAGQLGIVALAKELSGYNDLARCLKGNSTGCAWTILGLTPLKAAKLAKAGKAAKAGTSVVKYDADFALSQLTRSGSGKASELIDFATRQGWTRSQTATGPIKFVDNNGVTRLTIKSGSPRAPGSNFPHVEVRNAAGQRVDPYGNAVTRRSPGNHTPIEWDLP